MTPESEPSRENFPLLHDPMAKLLNLAFDDLPVSPNLISPIELADRHWPMSTKLKSSEVLELERRRRLNWRNKTVLFLAIASVIALVTTLVWGVTSHSRGIDPRPHMSHDDDQLMANKTRLLINEIEWLGPGGIRSPKNDSGQEYHLTFSLETPRAQAMLFQIESQRVHYLDKFDRGSEGKVTAKSFSGQCGDSEGHELLVLILVDPESADTVKSLESRVTPAQLGKIQDAFANPDLESVIRTTIMDVFDDQPWKLRGDDIHLLQCIEHSR